jgi:formamidopyrimidine-DNA glycosylase
MPELPEVETTVRGLARFLEGERIVSVRVNRPDMRRPFPPGLVQALTGATVSGLSRRAKYGLIHTDRDHAMVFHLGMSGRWRIDPEAPDKHDHLVLATEDHVFALNDPRRFGSVDLLLNPELDLWPPFAALGPEPLGEALMPEHLREATRGRKQAI